MAWYKPWTWFGGRDNLEPLPATPPRGTQVQPLSRRGSRVIGIEGREGHPGRKMNLADLLNAHDRAECGFPSLLYDIARDRLKADGHMQSHVNHRRDDVIRSLEVLPGGQEDRDQDAADELAKTLRKSLGFREALEAHQMAFWNGFALSEVDWRFQDGLFKPIEFKTPRPRRFVFDANDVPLFPTTSNYEGEPLRAGAWWYTRRYGDHPAVAGIAFTACLWSHIKSISMRDWLRLSDRFGIPFVYGTFRSVTEDDESATDDESIDVLTEAVEKLGKDRWAVFTESAEIKVTEAMNRGGGKGEIHSAIKEAADDEISKLVAGATTLSQTSGSTGSFAQSRVHADRGFNLYLSDASRLQHSLECYLGQAWVLFNRARFGDAAAPVFKFHLVQDQAPDTRAKVFAVARNELGMALDENQVRTELQLKPARGAAVIQPANDPPPEMTEGVA